MLLPAELAEVGPLLALDDPRLSIPPPPPPLPPPKPPEPLVPPKPPPPLEPPKLALLDVELPPNPLKPPKPELPLAASLKLLRPSDPLPVVGDSVVGPPPPLSRLLSTWTISSACAFL